MPEGDTLYRSAAGLRPHLVGRSVTAASARAPGPRSTASWARRSPRWRRSARTCSSASTTGSRSARTCGMHGSWHRYRPGERWKRAPARAPPGASKSRAPSRSASMLRWSSCSSARRGASPDALEARTRPPGRRFRRGRGAPPPAGPIPRQPLDRRGARRSARHGGMGNVYRVGGAVPGARCRRSSRSRSVDDATLRRLVDTSRRVLQQNVAHPERGPERVTTTGDRSAGGPLYVYGRAGRPCRRCGTLIRTQQQGGELPRITSWCPHCQPDPA